MLTNVRIYAVMTAALNHRRRVSDDMEQFSPRTIASGRDTAWMRIRR